jgi:Carboxypeptidase regulatory-like domain/TonB dependent receptor
MSRSHVRLFLYGIWSALFFIVPVAVSAQSNSGIVQGTVTDPQKAVVPGAKVRLENPVSGHVNEAQTGADGMFRIGNIPLNPYHLTVIAPGFDTFTQDVDVRSTLPISLDIGLKIGTSSTSVTVTENAQDLIEVTPTEHTDVDRGLFEDLPLESQSSSLSSLITLAAPGIVADSNGLFHGLGDHAENSFNVDGQPITDQQSKIFSNQIPTDSVQSLEVIEGAPPAEYGGKTSVVARVTTRSGLGQTTPHGEVTASYGSFGTPTAGMNVGFGTAKVGDFLSLSGLRSGRFLDGPEFVVLHDKGNEENAFDRLDFKLSERDTLQLNLLYTRSWFQNPNAWDQQLQTCTALSALCDSTGTTVLNPLSGKPLGPADQRSQILTYNIAPTWTRLVGTDAVFSFGVWLRHDQYNYYPSHDPFADLGPLQAETVSQLRFLTNAGARADYTYVKGIHNIKVGATFQHTFLTEKDDFGIVDPGLLASNGCPDPTNPICATLAPFDLTAGGTLDRFRGHTDVKETALYAEDDITKGPFSFNLGIRADFYNGLQTADKEAEPRLGVTYHVKKTNTVLRVSYGRTLESPFNENLILSGTGCTDRIVNAIMTVAQGFACASSPLSPAFRNEFHAGLQQAFGRYFVVSGEYIWKYTHNAYDFNVFGSTPIFLPIEWHNSKIPGFAIRAGLPNFHGLTAFVVMSHVSARFFPPTLSGIAPPQGTSVFRIDHDEAFAQTTHAQYQPFKRGPWFGFNWRYDSGLVAGQTPCFGDNCAQSTTLGGQPAIAMVLNDGITPLTADQEFQAGLTCNGQHATPTVPLPSVCLASQFGSTLLKVPAPGTENDDHNPPRVAARHLFDLAIGDDDLFHKSERYKVSARFTIINVANKETLYNFLSTFSGTHYVTPRTFTGEIGFHF